MKKGPTPICPECGSVSVESLEDELRCRRCYHAGTFGEFTKHVFYMDSPDMIVAPTARRHVPHLSDEEGGVDDEYGET